MFVKETVPVLRFVDLFSGIGGFRIAAENAAQKRGIKSFCVFSCDIDSVARKTYEANFGDTPAGDIREVNEHDIPEHDVLFAGFPCQPFSIIGERKGFDDARGTLFFEIARILEAKKPKAFVLENVKQLRGHDKGRTLKRIMETLSELGYTSDYRVLNALDFGLPQKRERIIIVGRRDNIPYSWPQPDVQMRPLSEILEPNVPKFYFASADIRDRRQEKRAGKKQFREPTIWHENKAGNVSAYPYSCALRAGASHNYLLVNGKRRLTEREMLRLQGFPDSFKIVCSYSAMRKQSGNAVPVPVIEAVFDPLLDNLTLGLELKLFIPTPTPAIQLLEDKANDPPIAQTP